MSQRSSRRAQVTLLGAFALAASTVPARAAGTIFLERCAAGCTYFPGFDDSRTNHSSLLSQTVTIPPFAHGDAAWAEHLACVRRAYAPFDVAVTDVDPGVAPHWEVVVAGLPANIGMPPNVGGVAPFNCAVIPNGIAYSFAAVYSDMRELCWTTAQETAHLFGLDHEFEQRDPMTYLAGCLEKVFSPANAECGETEPRPCTCAAARPRTPTPC